MKITTTLAAFATAAIIGLFAFQAKSQTNIAPLATVSASTCNTGPCSTLNDLNLGSCGTQSMWISTSGPPSTVPGVNWIQWDWPSSKTYNELVIHHAQTNARFLTGFTVQYWDGATWVTTETISGLTPACISNVKFSRPISAARFRITSFQMTAAGQNSNPNFREIEVIEAILGANNAAVAGLDSPTTFCAGTHNIIARIANRGINQINNVIVNWRYNGITQTPISFVGLLDTNGGSGRQDTAIFLGTRSFTAGVKQNLEVWTSMPNGVADTITQDDSLLKALQPSLAGTFTINPAGTGSTNYLSFNDAVSDLVEFGVCSPVIFNVTDGNYNEQVKMDAISGSSMANPIVFQAASTNVGPVLLSFAASTIDNYILNLNGSSYITFDGIDMTNTGAYGTTVRFESGASNNTIMNGVFTGNLTVNTTSNLYANFYANGANFENNRIMNDSIIGGSLGIYYFGSTTVFNPGLMIEGNYIENAYYMGMYVYGITDTRIANNILFGTRPYTSGYGIYSYYGGTSCEIVSNTILTKGVSTWPLYGITFGQNTNTSDQARMVVANNNVHMGTSGSTSNHYGIYSIGNIFTDVVYNNVAIEGTGTLARAGFITSGGLGVRVLNNNFLHYGNGYGLYTFSANAPICDNNNIASAGPNIGYFNTNTTNLAAWKTAGGGDNTINVDSIYVNLDSLRTCDTALFAKGAPVSGVMVDYDGDKRNPVTPNIGSDEYVASAELFTIGDTIEFCGGDELVLGSTMNGATFLWSNSATTPTITVTSEGNYSVIVNGPCATGMTDDVEVIDVNPVASFSFAIGDYLRGFNNSSEYGTSYLWDFGDGSTSTQENPFHKYAENGTYQVTLTVMNYCDTVTTTQTVGIYVGVNEISFGNNISIYPNPANDFFNIAVGDLEDQTVQMELVDMKGQVYANRLMKITKGSQEQIDISSLSKGVYLVRLTTESEVATKQIIVQ